MSGAHVASNQSGLDAAGKAWGYDTVLKINIVCCSLSLAGALVMIVPFFLSKQLRKVRHRMILGLAVNDLVQALAVLVPSLYVSFNNRRLRTDSPGCIADSFFYLALVVAGCLWALAIAVATYLTLVHPLSRLSRWLHYTWAMPAIWAGIWLVSFINSAIGTAIVPSIDAGGFCFFPSVPPNYYGNLIIFIPRTLVFIIVIALYVRLFVFFRRQSSRAKSIEGCLPSPMPLSSPRYVDAGSSGLQDYKPTLSGENVPDDKSPVYRVNSLQFKLAQYQFKGSRKGSKDSQATAADASTARGRPTVRRSSRSEETIQEVSENSPVLVQDSDAILNGNDGFEHQLVMLERLPSLRSVSYPASPRLDASLSNSGNTSWQQPTSGSPVVPNTSSYRFPAPIAPVIALPAENEQAEPQLDEKTAAYGAHMPVRSPSQISVISSRSVPRQQYQRVDLQKTETSTTQKTLGDCSETGADMGLWEALDAVAPQGVADGPNGGYGTGARRMSASEENKRVSYLMILYPLAYALIVAVSVARTLATLVTGLPPSPVLQILNRVLVLSVGAVDALIYTIVEWRFRAATRAASR